MKFEQKFSDNKWLPTLAVMLVFSVSIKAQSRVDEAQSAPSEGTITGQVTNDSGQPIPNATVLVRGSLPLFQAVVTATDNEGKFRFPGLIPALYGISANAPAYVSPPRDPDSSPVYYRLGDFVTISLIKGGVITGTVTSPSGDPLVQAPVSAVLVRDASGRPPKNYPFQQFKSTDDRGIYRIYGLTPGTYVVAAGGRNFSGPFSDPYDSYAQTYAPSSARDTAAEIVVRAGEETSGVDIRYRGEPGRVISGLVTGLLDSNFAGGISVGLMQIINGNIAGTMFTFQQPGSNGFAFYGVSDGDYDLVGQAVLPLGDILAIDPRRIRVKGSNITGIELTLKQPAAIEGRVVLEKSTAAECKNKRQPTFAETLVLARRSAANNHKDQPRFRVTYPGQGSPDKSGDFKVRNLVPGQYNLSAQFFAKYWYLRSIRRTNPANVATAAEDVSTKLIDVARQGVNLKFGERATGLVVTLAEGAASLRGSIKLETNQHVPPRLHVLLVPAEKENIEDVLRYFSAAVDLRGTFAFNNLAPGRYWVLTRTLTENEQLLESRLRQPEQTDLRAQIRRVAETGNTTLDFKPCQNLAEYQLALPAASQKNQLLLSRERL